MIVQKDDAASETTGRAGCIRSPVTNKYLCDNAAPNRSGGDYAGLDNAYRDAVTNSVYPCWECLRTAMIAMGLPPVPKPTEAVENDEDTP